MEVKDIWPKLELPGKTRLSFEINGSGTFLNDVAQHIKASGKSFRYKGRVDLTVNEDGLIEAVDEYYPLHFDSGKSIEDYRGREKDE